MDKHPLLFFKELTDSLKILTLEQLFIKEMNENPYLIKGDVDSLEFIVLQDCYDEEPVEVLIKFNSFLSNKLKEESDNLFNYLDSKVLTFSNHGNKEYFIRQLIAQFENVSFEINKSYISPNYKRIIQSHIQSISKVIILKYIKSEDTVSNKIKNISTGNINKLKWRGTKIQLATLFYDLANSLENKNGETFIDAQPKDLKEFISNCFFDNEGAIIKNDTTLDTYFTPSQYLKRGKAHIEEIATALNRGDNPTAKAKD